MIRDKTVFGIQDVRLKERMPRESPDLTIQKAIDAYCTAENTKNQLQFMSDTVPTQPYQLKERYGEIDKRANKFFVFSSLKPQSIRPNWLHDTSFHPTTGAECFALLHPALLFKRHMLHREPYR